MTYRLLTQDQRYQIAALHRAEISNKDIALVVTATRARSAGSCGATARTSSTWEAKRIRSRFIAGLRRELDFSTITASELQMVENQLNERP